MEERFYFKIWSTLTQHLKINCIKWTEGIVNGEKKKHYLFFNRNPIIKKHRKQLLFSATVQEGGNI